MPHKSSEVSDMFDIEPRTLFVYESENLIAPERTPTQRRRYSRRDIERIRLIRELTTAHGINLAGVKVIFSLMEAALQNRLQIADAEFPELAAARHPWSSVSTTPWRSGIDPARTLLALDFDGTIPPIAPEPDLALT